MSQSPEPTPSKPHHVLDELWREALGRQLRELRLARGERLEDTASRAGISPQYLSEIERGRKEPSSEMAGAVIGALDCTLVEMLLLVADSLTDTSAEVIELRSSFAGTGRVAESTPDHRHGPDRRHGIDASLSIAA